MTDDGTTVTTDAELNAAMVTLLERAAANGVDVRGGWECRTEQSDWDVVITELALDHGAD